MSQVPIKKLIIRLPAGLELDLQFFPHPEDLGKDFVADPDLPMKVTIEKLPNPGDVAVLDPRRKKPGPPMKDVIC